jgi:hypothetical protein
MLYQMLFVRKYEVSSLLCDDFASIINPFLEVILAFVCVCEAKPAVGWAYSEVIQ